MKDGKGEVIKNEWARLYNMVSGYMLKEGKRRKKERKKRKKRKGKKTV
jgi:hypothetical protein